MDILSHLKKFKHLHYQFGKTQFPRANELSLNFEQCLIMVKGHY